MMNHPEITEAELVTNPVKKAHPTLISWNDKKKVALLEQVYINKPYLA